VAAAPGDVAAAPGDVAVAPGDVAAAPGDLGAQEGAEAPQNPAGVTAPARLGRNEVGLRSPGKKRLPIRVPASLQPRLNAPARLPEPARQPESLSGLSARLMALARMIQIGSGRSGRDGFGQKLLADAEEILGRAGDRMRLSSSHTVVALAGGTGSGKSSLFNKIAGAEFSTIGVTRPVTAEAHACVWGEAGSRAILDWLKVPARYRYSRASALDGGEDDLAGLVLLDMPDHDSVMNQAGTRVDQLVSMADVMIWVLDPQKYADAAVHRRFLVPMGGHAAVIAVVLNQVDLLDPEQVDDCVADLRRLLDAENLHDVAILVTSAVTGAGLDDLRRLLADGVAARRAAAARISADLDGVVARFKPLAGDLDARVDRVPVTSKSRLTDRFAAAAGITAVGEALRSARELRAADFVGWPVAWFAQRLSGRNPLRKVRLGMLWNDLRSVTAGPAGAQQAEIDNALTDLGNELAESLPEPWSHTVRAAVRSEAEQIPAALGAAIGDVLPDEDSVVWWWRIAGVWQGLLLGAAAVAIAWIALIIVFGVFHAASGLPTLLSNTSALPWIVALSVGALVVGAASAAICMKVVLSAADRENAQVTAAMKEHVAAVAIQMVVVPAEQELSELERYREEARIAARGIGPAADEDSPASTPA
jgi:GTP-binding protein EngB required for normal cell division